MTGKNRSGDDAAKFLRVKMKSRKKDYSLGEIFGELALTARDTFKRAREKPEQNCAFITHEIFHEETDYRQHEEYSENISFMGGVFKKSSQRVTDAQYRSRVRGASVSQAEPVSRLERGAFGLIEGCLKFASLFSKDEKPKKRDEFFPPLPGDF